MTAILIANIVFSSLAIFGIVGVLAWGIIRHYAATVGLPHVGGRADADVVDLTRLHGVLVVREA